MKKPLLILLIPIIGFGQGWETTFGGTGIDKGQSVQQIAPLFKNAPDYNERVTLYQLNHLAGTSGAGTQYSCPSCEKLKTQNLCFATSECDNIINPLQFGRKKK